VRRQIGAVPVQFEFPGVAVADDRYPSNTQRKYEECGSMVRKMSGVIIALLLVSIAAKESAAQAPFVSGSSELALMVGAGELSGASAAYGVRFERGVGSMGSGGVGLRLSADVYTWRFGIAHRFTIMPIGLSANYHFPTEGKFRPFLSAGGGYKSVTCGGPRGLWADCSEEDDEFYPIARAGARFYTSESTAIVADAGLGGALVSVGLGFRLR
jgi:outer membrane protein W